MLKLDAINKMEEAYKEKHDKTGMILPPRSFYSQVVNYVGPNAIMYTIDVFKKEWENIFPPSLSYFFDKRKEYRKIKRS